jgi:hypothetical protein
MPGRMSKLTSLTATTLPYQRETPSSRMIGSAPIVAPLTG